MNKCVLAVSDVADMLGVSANTIYVMARRNEIPHFKIRSRVMFNREVLEAWTRDASLASVAHLQKEAAQ